jgi:hypothetical protein
MQKDLEKAKDKSSRLGTLASRFATKIQVMEELQEDFCVILETFSP